MTKAPNADDRRAARKAELADLSAAEAAKRRGDAELDLPGLTALRALAADNATTLVAKAETLADDLIVTKAANGLALAPQIMNLKLTAQNMVVILDSLIADADAALKD